MKLITKEQSKLLQAQFSKGSDLSQLVVVKIFDPTSQWTWYVMNQDPNDPDYLWGIVRGDEIETGSFSLSELEKIRGRFGLGLERDLWWTPIPAKEVWEKLNRGEHV